MENIRRIYMLSDLHFGVRNNSISWKDMMTGYIDWFIDDIKANGFKKGCDSLFILGDVFNSRESVNMMILSNVTLAFNKLKQEIGDVRVLVGNHDTYYLDNNDITSIEFIETSTGIKGYYSPEKINVNGHNMMILPWNNSYDSINEYLSSDDSEFLFCHMDIDGMKYSSGIDIKNAANREILSRYRKVFSGHIHVRQESGNVLYVGSPYQLDVSDTDKIRGYYYIDCEDDFKTHFFENTFSPTFKTVSIFDILNNSVDYVKSLIDNSYVNVICDSNTYQNMDLIKFRSQLEDFGINFKKMSFSQNSSITGKTSMADDLSSFSFDIVKSSIELLEAQKKPKDRIESVMKYLTDLYSETKKIINDGV